ncbi:MAG: c-type cytochrome, partial [Flavobacteriales bacterium]
MKRPYPVARGLASIMAGAMLIASVPATAGIWDEGDIENGQALFNANCASCHKVTNEVLAAPG